jgi:hypothetical protein
MEIQFMNGDPVGGRVTNFLLEVKKKKKKKINNL